MSYLLITVLSIVCYGQGFYHQQLGLQKVYNHYQLHGQGIKTGVIEMGLGFHDHIDFSGADQTIRTLGGQIGNKGRINNHSTLVASALAGNGLYETLNYFEDNEYLNFNILRQLKTIFPTPYQGVAKKSSIRWDLPQNKVDQYKLNHVTNHSYTTGEITEYFLDLYTWGRFDKIREYNLQSKPDLNRWDQYGKYKNLPAQRHVVVAAGNFYQGGYLSLKGFASLSGNSKNSIIVGASNSNDGTVAQFSSRGPTEAEHYYKYERARLKPDLLAPGCSSPIPINGFKFAISTISFASDQISESFSFNFKNPEAKEKKWYFGGAIENGKLSHQGIIGATKNLNAWKQTLIYSFDSPKKFQNINSVTVNLKLLGDIDEHLYPGATSFTTLRLIASDGTHYDFFEPLTKKFPLSTQTIFDSISNGNYENVTFDLSTSNIEKLITHVVIIPIFANPFEKFASVSINKAKEKLNDPMVYNYHPAMPSKQLSNKFDPIRTSSYSFFPTYESVCGTSMASPATSGVIALMLEAFTKQSWFNSDIDSQEISPATIKALLIHTAEDVDYFNKYKYIPNLQSYLKREPVNFETDQIQIPTPGPDFHSGYGIINAKDAIDLIYNKDFYGEILIDPLTAPVKSVVKNKRDRQQFKINIDDEDEELKVTLVWDDPPFTEFGVRQSNLVNDLDLYVINPQGSFHYPFTVDIDDNGIPLGAARVDRPDRVNNVEQVLITKDDLQLGEYNIYVQAHSDIKFDEQRFSLVITKKRKGVYLSNHQEVEVPQMNFKIKSLYPNPSRSDQTKTLHIESPSGLEARYQVFNILGQAQMEKSLRLHSGTNKLQLDTHHLNSGVYIFRMVVKNKVFQRKFTIL